MANNIENAKIYSEIHSILNAIDEADRKRVPKKCLELIENKRARDYNPKYDLSRPLKEQNVKQETISLLALLYLNYWCDSEEEKNELMNIFNENEIKYQEELREKYNPDNLFKKKEENRDNTEIEELSVVEYKKQNFIQRLIDKIKKVFKRNKS